MADNLGNFAGGFLEAFTSVVSQQQQAAQRKKIIDAQTKLIEAKLEAGERFEDLLQQPVLTGEMQRSPEMEAVLPGAQVTVPETRQRGLVDLLAEGGEGALLAVQSGMADIGDVAAIQGREALQQSLEGVEDVGEFFRTGEGFSAALEGGVDPTRMLAASDFQAQLDTLKFQVEMRDFLRDAQQAFEEKTAEAFTISDILDDASELDAILGRLEGTLLEPGTPAISLTRDVISGAAALLSRFNMDMSAQQKAVDDFDRFTKLISELGVNLLGKMEDAGSLTNDKLRLHRARLANENVSLDANRRNIADIIDDALRSALTGKLEISDEERARLEGISQRLRGAEQQERQTISFDALPER